MLKRLPIALAQVKVRNTSENLLNDIRQIIHSLYREKEITKKVYDSIMNSVKLWNRMVPYLWILKIVGHLILIDYYSILQIK